MSKRKTKQIISKGTLLSACYVLVPVECKIPRFVQFMNKDSTAGETNKTPGKLYLSAASTIGLFF